MQSVKFYLKDPNSENDPKCDNPTLIYLFWSFDGKRLKYSTGETIKPSEWNSNPKVQRVKKSVTGSIDINGYLNDLDAKVKAFYRIGVTNKDTVTPDYLREKLDDLKNGKNSKQSLFEFIDTYIKSIKALRTASTIQIYNNTLSHLRAYKEYSRKNIDFETITLDFYNDFTDYLIKEKDFSTNTIGKIIKTLKSFLNEATERGINTKLDFKSKRFKVVNQDSEKIYLSEAEIETLYKLDLSHHDKLDKVRDLFIIGCETGLRFSDLSQLKKENINDGLIKIRSQKTNEIVVIPLSKLVKNVLEKYKGNLPNSISNQKTNEYLKELGGKANLNQTIEITQNKGDTKIKLFKEKKDLITTHTARRSFATNLYLKGFPTISIMKITGHKTEKAFMKYLKISQEQNAELLAKFWKEHKI
jgi:integrase